MRRHRGVPLALAAVALLALACGGAERDDSGAIVGAGNVSAFELRVGDCFNLPLDTEGLVSSLAAVPCAEPHDRQVLGLVDYPEGGDEYPGERAMRDFSSAACLELFEPFVGESYGQARFLTSALFPSTDSWEQGDREVVCFLYDASLELWTGTAEGLAE